MSTTSHLPEPAIRRETLGRPAIAVPGNRGIKVIRACTIRRPAGELYRFWRSLENLATVIKHPVSITRISDIESEWVVSAPTGGHRVRWRAVLINDEPDRLIAWRSTEGADVPNAGTVRFEPAPADEGTEVTVQLEYDPPGGKLGALVAKLTGDEAKQQVADALRRFKALMETGEMPTTEGQPVGEPQRSRLQRKAAS
jgi:uncharacterized membrane protein